MKKILDLFKNKLFILLVGIILFVGGQLLESEFISLAGTFFAVPILSLWITSAFVNVYCQRKTKRIFRWFHRPILQIPICLPRYSKNKGYYISRDIKFNETNITEDGHTNKLFGYTVGKFFGSSIHKNSFRFGYNVKKGKINLVAYHYIDSIRYDVTIKHNVPLNTSFQLTLHRDDDHVTFTVTNKKNKDKIKRVVNFKSKYTKGYECGIFYGGKPTAPHTIKIELTR